MTTVEQQLGMDGIDFLHGNLIQSKLPTAHNGISLQPLAISDDVDSLEDIPDVGAVLERSGILDTGADASTPNSLKSFGFSVEDSGDSLPFEGLLGLPDRTSSTVSQSLPTAGDVVFNSGIPGPQFVPFVAQFPLEAVAPKPNLVVVAGPNQCATNLPSSQLLINRGIITSMYNPQSSANVADGNARLFGSIFSGADDGRKLVPRSRNGKNKLGESSGLGGFTKDRDAPEYQRVMDILTQYRVQVAEKSAEAMMPCKRRKSRPLVDAADIATCVGSTASQPGAISSTRNSPSASKSVASSPLQQHVGLVTERSGDLSSCDSAASNGPTFDFHRINGFETFHQTIAANSQLIGYPPFGGVQSPISVGQSVSESNSSASVKSSTEVSSSSQANTATGSVSCSAKSESPSNNRTNGLETIPECDCITAGSYDEAKEGPYYTQLGAASSIDGLRELMETRLGMQGAELRIERVRCTAKQGSNSLGCPVPKWILRRSGSVEKALCLVRHRAGHSCATAVLAVAVILWDAVNPSQADHCYDYLRDVLPSSGLETQRRCGLNEQRTCACQGWDPSSGGASYTYGCSWSIFHGGCKFARSSDPRRFRLKHQEKEAEFEQCIHRLASTLGLLCQSAVPDAYTNMVEHDEVAGDCRLGTSSSSSLPRRPFSGVTAVLDYSTHSHKDVNNMHGGCTAVVTLTKTRGDETFPDDEQLHVLPFYQLDSTSGSRQGVECRTSCPTTVRLRDEPYHPAPRYRLTRGRHAIGGKRKIPGVGNCGRPRAVGAAKRKHSSDDDVVLSSDCFVRVTDVCKQTSCDGFEARKDYGRPRSKSVTESEPLVGKDSDSFESEKPLENPSLGTEKLCLEMEKPSLEMKNSSFEMEKPFLEMESRSLDMEKPSLETEKPTSAVLSSCDASHIVSSSHSPVSHSGPVLDANVGPSRREVSTDLVKSESSRCDAMDDGSDEQSDPQRLRSSPEFDTAPPQSAECSRRESHGCVGEETGKAGNDEQSRLQPAAGYASGSPKSSLDQRESEKPDFTIRTNAARTASRNIATESAANGSSAVSGEAQDVEGQPRSLKAGRIVGRDVNIDNTDILLDADIGGVAIALTHGSVMFEVAKREVHASTALRRPDRRHPTRLSLVFYQHQRMNRPQHGSRLSNRTSTESHIPVVSPSPDEVDPVWGENHRSRRECGLVESKSSELTPGAGGVCLPPVMRVSTLTTTTTVTKWIQPKPVVTGHYQCWG